MFLKGVLGYGSILHLKNAISSVVHQTRPTNQHKKNLGMLLMAAKKANSLIKLIFLRAGNEKSMLKVTLVPGSAHTDIPIITAQKGFWV